MSTTEFLCHFDGTDGATTLTDESANGYTNTVDGTTALDTSAYVFGTASLFLPSASTSNYASFSGVSLPDTFTIDLRVLVDSWGTSEDNIILNIGNRIQVYHTYSDSMVYFLFQNFNGSGWDQVALLSTSHQALENMMDSWHHVGITVGTSGLEVTIDGVSIATSTATFPADEFSTTSIVFGGSSPMQCWIDECRIESGVEVDFVTEGVPTAAYTVTEPPDVTGVGTGSLEELTGTATGNTTASAPGSATGIGSGSLSELEGSAGLAQSLSGVALGELSSLTGNSSAGVVARGTLSQLTGTAAIKRTINSIGAGELAELTGSAYTSGTKYAYCEGILSQLSGSSVAIRTKVATGQGTLKQLTGYSIGITGNIEGSGNLKQLTGSCVIAESTTFTSPLIYQRFLVR